MSNDYYNAPISKMIVLLSFFSSVALLAASQERFQYDFFNLDLNQLSNGQIWRLLTSHLGFNSPLQFMIGNLFLHHFRIFERQMGSSKFAGFVFLINVISTTLQLALLITFGIPSVSSGPFALIFADFVLFNAIVPKLSPTYLTFFGINISDKTALYAAALWMALFNGLESLIPAFTGVLLGFLYYYEVVFTMQSVAFPESIRNFAKTYILPLIASEPPRNSRSRQRNAADQQRNQIEMINRMRQNGGFAALPQNVVAAPPSEEAITVLTSMGFDRASAVAALMRSDNNTGVAANYLLSR